MAETPRVRWRNNSGRLPVLVLEIRQLMTFNEESTAASKLSNCFDRMALVSGLKNSMKITPNLYRRDIFPTPTSKGRKVCQSDLLAHEKNFVVSPHL